MKTTSCHIQRMSIKELKELPVHPAADAFTMLPQDELAALADDIKENGQYQPILVANGQLIDGRNRRQACIHAGLPARVKDLGQPGESEIVQRIFAENVHRRHLTTRERAQAALKLYEGNDGAYTLDEVAEMFRISRRSITNARYARDGKPRAKKRNTAMRIAVPGCVAEFVNAVCRIEGTRDTELRNELLRTVEQWDKSLRKRLM